MPEEQVTDTFAVILARMEVKLDHALARGDDHEVRIRVLERKVWTAAGLVGLIGGGGASFLFQILGG